MEQNQKKEAPGMESVFTTWTKSVTDFWGDMAKMQFSMPGGSEEKTRKGPIYQAQKSWESGNKIFRALLSNLTEPETMNEFMKGMESLPEFLMKMTQQSWDGYLELQKKWTDKVTTIGKHTEAYSFEDIDENIFNTWKEIYEKEIQKFLNVPQLGLTRFQQERINRFVDKYNLFRNALNEFIYMFYIPIEKSSAVMQEKVEQLIEQGEIHDNFKDYYNMWIKILEGHYMTLLKSPEYTQVMNNTIDALVEYRNAKNEVMYDFLQNLPIPTNRDMDELYKDLYLLKKQVRELARELKSKQ